MSKAAKKRNAERRRSEKQKRKAANRAAYQGQVGTAANTKKKTGASGNLINKMPGHPHITGDCGNVGCRKCFPELNR